MKCLRLSVALCIGAGITFLQFAAVAALNEARQTYTEAVKRSLPPPLVVQPVKKITPTTISAPQKALYASASEPVTRKIPAPVSALPALGASQVSLGIGTALPTLDGGLGHVTGPEPAESDRSARARRTVEPSTWLSRESKGMSSFD